MRSTAAFSHHPPWLPCVPSGSLPRRPPGISNTSLPARFPAPFTKSPSAIRWASARTEPTGFSKRRVRVFVSFFGIVTSWVVCAAAEPERWRRVVCRRGLVKFEHDAFLRLWWPARSSRAFVMPTVVALLAVAHHLADWVSTNVCISAGRRTNRVSQRRLRVVVSFRRAHISGFLRRGCALRYETAWHRMNASSSRFEKKTTFPFSVPSGVLAAHRSVRCLEPGPPQPLLC